MSAGEPLVLALDTSTPTLSAALMRGRETLGSVQAPAARNHSAHAVPAVQRLLREAGVRGTELAGIAAGVGPGSYTGVRIAATIAKTLAWTWSVPLVGVSTLEALAAGAWREAAASDDAARPSDAPSLLLDEAGSGADRIGAADGGGTAAGVSGVCPLPMPCPRMLADEAGGWIVPLLDARRGQAYTALFAAGAAPGLAEGEWLPADAPWRRLEPDGLRLMDGWASQLAELLAAADRRPAYVLFAGEMDKHEEGIRRFQALAAATEDGPAVCGQPHSIDGRSVAWLGARSLAGGEAVDAHGLVPNYTQLAEAEAKLLEKSREEKNDGRL
ncbi:tRNA (adenosine(37)-N6)-threonylcarbamoyltransferase complex dimerization subunit type 1 TsaB [Paenibacillus albicereus]|uniref:tRNA (Adenosine(37)-N6)-threonylcarbamoyltransferase complex dimerization subunit type 1 TsaB n=2 Tax=Paenibacillus albicereus TaxID=2726185 RepID=A0A6H2H4F7_9BACL|nr:tRNA (adenosine(37)-N6)-threonylcarbamoyltransferase complex dimerization subunit type 1 TsaB [Paenibacillus albicereus]